MTSKKLNEILNITRRLPYIALTPKQVEELIKDLEILEILKEYLTSHILEELCIEEKEVWEWLGNDIT